MQAQDRDVASVSVFGTLVPVTACNLRRRLLQSKYPHPQASMKVNANHPIHSSSESTSTPQKKTSREPTDSLAKNTTPIRTRIAPLLQSDPELGLTNQQWGCNREAKVRRGSRSVRSSIRSRVTEDLRSVRTRRAEAATARWRWRPPRSL